MLEVLKSRERGLVEGPPQADSPGMGSLLTHAQRGRACPRRDGARGVHGRAPAPWHRFAPVLSGRNLCTSRQASRERSSGQDVLADECAGCELRANLRHGTGATVCAEFSHGGDRHAHACPVRVVS
jgi:hypothetical protein